MKRIFSLLVLVTFLNPVVFSQEGDTDSMMVYTNKKGKLIRKSGDELYFGFTPGFANRTLKENPGLFSAPIGERENETGGWFYSFHIGYRTNLHKHIVLDLGVEFNRNGEFYETGGDSVYTYKNTYHYIGIPLNLAFQYGDRFKLHVGAGVVPKMFLSQVTNEERENEFGTTEAIRTKYKDNFNFFNIDAVVSLGFRWNFSRNVGIYAIPEMRWQLANTYQKQWPYVHKSYVFGIKAGVSVLF